MGRGWTGVRMGRGWLKKRGACSSGGAACGGDELSGWAAGGGEEDGGRVREWGVRTGWRGRVLWGCGCNVAPSLAQGSERRWHGLGCCGGFGIVAVFFFEIVGVVIIGVFVFVGGFVLVLVFDLGFVLVLIVIDEFDFIVEVAGVGGVEDGDGAAALFVGGFGLVQSIDECADRVEAGVGRRGWGPRKKRSSIGGPKCAFVRPNPRRVL